MRYWTLDDVKLQQLERGHWFCYVGGVVVDVMLLGHRYWVATIEAPPKPDQTIVAPTLQSVSQHVVDWL